MRKIKTGIIGIGNMGTSHAINLTEDHCPEMELTAVADTSPERRAWAKENLPGVCVYGTAEELLDRQLGYNDPCKYECAAGQFRSCHGVVQDQPAA